MYFLLQKMTDSDNWASWVSDLRTIYTIHFLEYVYCFSFSYCKVSLTNKLLVIFSVASRNFEVWDLLFCHTFQDICSMLSSIPKDSTFFPLFLLQLPGVSCIPIYQHLTTQNTGFFEVVFFLSIKSSNKTIIELILLCLDFLPILLFFSSKIHPFVPSKMSIKVSAVEEYEKNVSILCSFKGKICICKFGRFLKCFWIL